MAWSNGTKSRDRRVGRTFLRASIRPASYPHDAKTPHDIIRQADEMMYMVKNSTRDNIGIAQRGVVK